MPHHNATLLKKLSLGALLTCASLISTDAFMTAPADCRLSVSVQRQPGAFGDYAAVERWAGNEPACEVGDTEAEPNLPAPIRRQSQNTPQ
jgi:hypothetical protein